MIEKAEKNFSEKVMKPASVASAVTANIVKTKSPIKKEPVPARERDSIVEPVDEKPKRRVFVDSDKDQRKVSSKQTAGNIQISVSASNTERKKIKEGDLRNKLLNRDKVKPSDDPPRRHGSPERRDRDVERGRDRDVGKIRDRDIDKYKRRESREEQDYRRVSRNSKEDKVEVVTHRRVSRRESVDEAKFIPDYDEDSDSDHSPDSSDSDSSSEDEAPRRKHKHKKVKHKKLKKHKKKEKKEKKKKKHKHEKEGKIKSVR